MVYFSAFIPVKLFSSFPYLSPLLVQCLKSFSTRYLDEPGMTLRSTTQVDTLIGPGISLRSTTQVDTLIGHGITLRSNTQVDTLIGPGITLRSTTQVDTLIGPDSWYIS